jgi:putative peptide zinc metalloprotease protein
MALREQSRLRAGGMTADAAVEGARIDGLKAEVDLWEHRLDRTRIRSTVAGLLATPRIEETVGSALARGAVFCEVVDPGKQRIEVVVEESDAGLVSPGMPVKVKLNSYPTVSFRASVERVGVAAIVERDTRSFLVRAGLGESDPAFPLRTGMTGWAKIDTGPASAGRVLLRVPARWIWTWMWGWLP